MNYMYSVNANNGHNADHRELRRQDRSQHRPGADAIAYVAGAVAVAGAGRTQRAHGAEIAVRAADAGRAVFAARALMTASSSPTTPTSTWWIELTRVPGIATRAGLRRRPVCDALLGEARSTGQAADHGSADHRGHPGAKHRESRRTDRRRAGSARPAIHLHGSRAGPSVSPRNSAISSFARIRTDRFCG